MPVGRFALNSGIIHDQDLTEGATAIQSLGVQALEASKSGPAQQASFTPSLGL